MINKQKFWFLTLFSLILVLSVYYITMPSELLTTSNTTSKKVKEENSNVTVTETDVLTVLQVEADEERAALAAEYNEVLTNKESSTEEKNNAYDGLKQIDDLKSKEEELKKKIKEKLSLNSFVKINGKCLLLKGSKVDEEINNSKKALDVLKSDINDIL